MNKSLFLLKKNLYLANKSKSSKKPKRFQQVKTIQNSSCLLLYTTSQKNIAPLFNLPSGNPSASNLMCEFSRFDVFTCNGLLKLLPFWFVFQCFSLSAWQFVTERRSIDAGILANRRARLWRPLVLLLSTCIFSLFILNFSLSENRIRISEMKLSE